MTGDLRNGRRRGHCPASLGFGWFNWFEYHALADFVKRRLRAVIVPLLLLVVTGYFVYNAIKGTRGITAQQHDRAILAQDDETLAKVDTSRNRWQARVDALRHHAIAKDMLNDQARAVLNLANPDDLSVPLQQPVAKPAPPITPSSQPHPRSVGQ